MELSPLWDRRSGIWDTDDAGCEYRYDYPGHPYCDSDVEEGQTHCPDHGGCGYWD